MFQRPVRSPRTDTVALQLGPGTEAERWLRPSPMQMLPPPIVSGQGHSEFCALMSCLCRQALLALVRLLEVILNLPFIRDQRKELKARVWGFQKNLQDWGGEAKQPQALKGSRHTSTVSLGLEATHSQPVMWGDPQKTLGSQHQHGVDTALGHFLGGWAVVSFDSIKNLIIKPKAKLLWHCIKSQVMATCPSEPSPLPWELLVRQGCLQKNENAKGTESQVQTTPSRAWPSQMSWACTPTSIGFSEGILFRPGKYCAHGTCHFSWVIC